MFEDQMRRHERRQVLREFVLKTLSDDPEALSFALEGITLGMAGAIDRANKRAAQKDRAMLAAFSLLAPDRLSAGLKEMLGGWVIQGCADPSLSSNVEQQVRNKVQASAPGIEARQGGDNSVGSVEDESPTRREAPNTLHTHPNPKREEH